MKQYISGLDILWSLYFPLAILFYTCHYYFYCPNTLDSDLETFRAEPWKTNRLNLKSQANLIDFHVWVSNVINIESHLISPFQSKPFKSLIAKCGLEPDYTLCLFPAKISEGIEWEFSLKYLYFSFPLIGKFI